MFKRPSRGAVDEFMVAALREPAVLGIFSIFLSLLVIFTSNIIDEFSLPSIYLLMMYGGFGGSFFLGCREKKRAIPENQLNFTIEKTYSQVKFLTISIFLITVIHIILYLQPLLIIELDVVNFSQPLSEITNWLYLFEGIFLCGLAYIIHSRRSTLRLEYLPCPNCAQILKYISEEQQYYCENCDKRFKRKK